MDTKKFKKRLEGVVTSDKGDKTIVVTVQRRYKHPKYSKFLFKTAKYHAHDEKNEGKVGERVTIVESRPYSKMKTWELLKLS